ncbi:MAG: hypothetical protein ABI365_09700 [Lysobacteraceae bacterium]
MDGWNAENAGRNFQPALVAFVHPWTAECRNVTAMDGRNAENTGAIFGPGMHGTKRGCGGQKHDQTELAEPLPHV